MGTAVYPRRSQGSDSKAEPHPSASHFLQNPSRPSAPLRDVGWKGTWPFQGAACSSATLSTGLLVRARAGPSGPGAGCPGPASPHTVSTVRCCPRVRRNLARSRLGNRGGAQRDWEAEERVWWEGEQKGGATGRSCPPPPRVSSPFGPGAMCPSWLPALGGCDSSSPWQSPPGIRGVLPI